MKLQLNKVFHFLRPINRKYKDKLFRFIFHDKKDLLSLYNAVNGTDYQDPEELEINTLENVIYLKMKNDLSFLVGASMNLYEHQSTWNPNMPLRGLLYFAELYERHVKNNGYLLTKSKRIILPFPKYIVFYNGLEKDEDRRELRLSESFEIQRDGAEPALECRAVILNINYGHNRELMEKCQRLQEYAEFIWRIRENLQKGMTLKKAIDKAIEYCLEHGILTDILQRSQAEVRSMLLEEYNEKAEREQLRKEGWEEGREKGLEEGRKEGLEEGREEGRKEGREEEIQRFFKTLASLVDQGTLSLEQAEKAAGERGEEFLCWNQKR